MTFLKPRKPSSNSPRSHVPFRDKPWSPAVAIVCCASVAAVALTAVYIRDEHRAAPIDVAHAAHLAQVETAAGMDEAKSQILEKARVAATDNIPDPQSLPAAPDTPPSDTPQPEAPKVSPSPELRESAPRKAETPAVKDAQDDVTVISLRPHKALYDVRLTSLKTGAQISNLHGQMFFEWKQDCEAWISDHRANLFYEYPEGGAVNITTDFSTYEGLDAKSLSFNTRREQGGKLFEEFRGYADLDEGGEGQARFTIPDGLTHQLPAGTLFPMQHTIQILQKAHEGVRFYNATIFDGSDDEGPHDVNTFISDKITVDAALPDTPALDKSVMEGKPWLLRMAYFPLKSEEENADYEMTLVAYDNGVVSYVAIEYEKFAIEQRLIALEAVDRPDCTR